MDNTSQPKMQPFLMFFGWGYLFEILKKISTEDSKNSAKIHPECKEIWAKKTDKEPKKQKKNTHQDKKKSGLCTLLNVFFVIFFVFCEFGLLLCNKKTLCRHDIPHELHKILEVTYENIEQLKPVACKEGVQIICHVRSDVHFIQTSKAMTDLIDAIESERLGKRIQTIYNLRKMPDIIDVNVSQLGPENKGKDAIETIAIRTGGIRGSGSGYDPNAPDGPDFNNTTTMSTTVPGVYFVFCNL